MYRLFLFFKLKSVQCGILHKYAACCIQIRYTSICRLVILCCSLLLGCRSVLAQGIPVVDVFDGANGDLANSTIRPALKDNVYFANQASIRIPAVKDIITFKINEESKLVLKNAFTATVVYKITYWDKNNAVVSETTNRQLQINYDPSNSKTYKAYSDYVFDNAYGIQLQIINCTYTPPNTGFNPTAALQLSVEIQPNHLYKFDRVQNAVPQFTGTGTLNAAMPVADELLVNWDAVSGASEYDLEWSYVDLYAGADLNTLVDAPSPSDADLDRLVFRNNASRVTLNSVTKNYSIPLFYDGKGTLVYRIRSAQAQPDGQRLEAVWSKAAFFKYDGHQAKLNWQASTSYAEEGKRKSVLQYFDGSLRNRQTVTKDNSTNTTVVAETIYDYQGRPAIQVLPAPTLNKLISYTPNFNTLNNAAYDKDNFDLLAASATSCTIAAAPLGSQSGAAQYYSGSNPALGNTELLKKEPFNQYIPDAQGFPFTETQYMQDGTGRLYKQSGVGAQYQVGSGHETVYYYGNPDQQELDALFGTEAGDASHYFKNMVKDANGQFSISYADMHGRTIATALAGNLPDGTSLTDLPSKALAAKTITKVLTDKNNNLVKGWSIESGKALVIPKGTSNAISTFTYSFDPSSLVLQSCAPANQNIYYDCLYDLEITISGDCDTKFNNGQPLVIKKSNFTLGQIDVTSQPANKFSWTFDVALPEGSYTITKKLTVSADGLNFYRDQVFLSNNTCKTLEQFIQEQKDIFAQLQLNCNPTSAGCMARIGTIAAFRAAYLQSNGITEATAADDQAIALAYKNAITECGRLATNEKNGQNDLQGIYQGMLADVSPGGQYANLDMIDKYSVFSKGPDPLHYTYANSLYAYKDEFGNSDLVTEKYGLYDDDPTVQESNAHQFIANFKPSWAETLVQAHPEYCQYAVLRDQVGDASYTWDNDFLNTKTYAAAQAKGYLNPTANTTFVTLFATRFEAVAANADPLAAINPGYKTSMENFLTMAFSSGTENYSLWSAASGAGICKDNNDIVCRNRQKINPFSLANASCTADLDMAWVSFRGMYYAQKRKIIAGILLTNGCPVDYADLTKTIQAGPADDLTNFKHTVYFDDPAKTVASSTGLSEFNGATLQTMSQEEINMKTAAQKQFFYANTCNSYAKQWWNQLAPCTTDKLLLKQTAILADLANVCKLGSDDNHINGSSSINPAKTNRFKTFEDVIKFYVNQYNSTASATDKINPVTCNGLLITYPLPYEAPIPVNKPIFKKPDDCDCGQIAAIRTTYNNLPPAVKDASFSDYLQRTQHISISNADLDVLRDLCNGTECNFLASPVILPPGLQCGAGDVCVSCSKVVAVYNSFKTDYPGIAPTITDVDEPQRTYNQMFAKYMNNRLGFGKQAADYLAFINECGVVNPYTCDDLQKIINGFSGAASTPADCKNAFTQYFNQQQNTNYTYEQIDAVYINTCGNHPGSCTVPQNDDCAQNRTFIKSIGTNTGATNIYDAKQTADGGYVVTGYETGFGVANNDAHITKVDKMGNIEWSKTYGGPQYDYFSNIQTTADGGYIAVGTMNSSAGLTGGQIWVLKTDAAGNKQWSKTFGGTAGGNVGNRIIELAGGGYVFNGYYNFVAGVVDYALVRLTPAGDIVWSKQFGTNNSDQPGAILEDGDSLVLTSTYWSGAYDAVLLKASKTDGSIGWAKAFDVGSQSNFFYDIAKNKSGYSITGVLADGPGTNPYGSFIRVTPNGIPLRSVKIGRAVATVANYGQLNVYPTFDGGFVMTESPDNGDADVYVQKSDSNGVVIWANQVNIPGRQTAGKILQNADGSFFLGAASGNNALLIKTNLLGKTLCNDLPVTIDNTQPAATLLNNSFSYTVNNIPNLVVANVDNIGVSRIMDQAVLCMQDPCAQPVTTGPVLCGRNEALVKQIANYREETPCDDLLQFSTSRGMEQYNNYIEKIKGEFTNNYIAQCLQVENESFTVTQEVSEYHYTLYYYDQAGNLVKTIPPAGVNANYTTQWMDAVKAARAAHTEKPQVHTLVTQYRYNTLNQVIAQKTPDAGLSNFWYDRLGRLAISQNAKQKLAANNYSYTKYDYLGRIFEVGQINTPATAMADNISRFPVLMAKWLTDNAAKRQQITSTQYDLAGKDLGPFVTINARNLRNRVSFTSFTAGNTPANYTTATYYNYDIHGNVSTLLQDYGAGSVMGLNGQQYKRIDYQYDLISGKVNEVAYQKSYKDHFYHRYSYDAENRLTEVYTSTDYTRWEQDANYEYYKHGPLARTELGNQHVQGLDYAYTLQGWLKSVNGTVLNVSGAVADMGGDGGPNNLTRAQDVYGYSLHYNDDDYRAIGNAQWLGGVKNKLPAVNGYKPLFNGNISSMAVNLPVNGGVRGGAPMLYNYSYDQLNRLISMHSYKGANTGTQLWDGGLTRTPEWAETISYDANGNILTYKRNGDARSTATGKGMDDLSYVYKPNTNQLLQVTDAISTTLTADYNDIKTQAANNYEYDAIGNLTKDVSAGIAAGGISWTVYGKIAQIKQTKAGVLQTIDYTYDAGGNRISKKVGAQTTWYVRDASGNTMAVYGIGDNTINGGKITLREQHLYGSSRLGIRTPNLDVTSLVIAKFAMGSLTANAFFSSFDRGNKLFELNNHLGNVWVTISDKKIGVDTNGDGIIDYWNADVANANDYAPFGMQLVGRKYQQNISTYRYGFNGKENDNEVKGEGNQQDYGMRIYDPRLGRFLSVDPIGINFPWNSPYSYAENDPVNFIDLDGSEKAKPATVDMARELINVVGGIIANTKTQLTKATDKSVIQKLQISLELDKRTYAALMVFVYRNAPSNAERFADILQRSDPYITEGLDLSPAGDVKVVFTGKNFKGEDKNRYAAVGFLALDIFGGEILGGLGKAGKALRRGLTGAGKNVLEGVVKKTGKIVTALDELHVRAAVNDIFGRPVVINGKAFDHLTEVRNALQGIGNQIGELNKLIVNSNTGRDVVEAATELRNTLQKQKDEINAVLDRASKSAANK